MKKDKLENEILDLASKLISFKTVKDNDSEFVKLFNFVKSLFDENLFDFSLENGDASPVLFLKHKGSQPETYICSHIDVVPAQDQSQFETKIIDDKFFGRGSLDMKTQAAISLLLLKEGLNIGVILTSDEEGPNTINGATFAAEKLKNVAKLVIVPDGEPSYGITYKDRGMGQYKIISHGIGSRYSFPWRGKNPYVNLMKFFLGLDQIFVDSVKASEENFWYTTYNLVSMNAKSESKVPDDGEMDILVNFTPEFNRDSLMEKLKTYAKDFDCDVEEVFFGSPYELSKDDELLQKLKNGLDKEIGFETKLLTMGGIADARHFSERGIPTLLCSIGGEGAHSITEHANIDSVVAFYGAVKKFIEARLN